jgi:hypothetical protein
VTVDEDRSGVLLVRVWLEDGADGFRARLTALGPGRRDEEGQERTVALASSPAATAAAVFAWLRDVVGVPTDPGPSVAGMQ